MVLKMKLKKINNLQINFINQLLECLKKRKIYYLLKDNICGVDLADMQLISNYNKGITILFCAIDLFSKYAWVVPLKEKKKLVLNVSIQS